MSRYLLFVSLPYAYSILRPLQQEIRKRGGVVVWFVETGCPDALLPDEKRLKTVQEVIDFAPLAVFSPSNYIPDFFRELKFNCFMAIRLTNGMNGGMIILRLEAGLTYIALKARVVRQCSRNWKVNMAFSGFMKRDGRRQISILRSPAVLGPSGRQYSIPLLSQRL